MNVAMVERNCANCPLQAMERCRAGGLALRSIHLDPENDTELQLARLERRYGPNWKW